MTVYQLRHEINGLVTTFFNACSTVSCDRVRETGNDAELLH